jgi:hypothetical protein
LTSSPYPNVCTRGAVASYGEAFFGVRRYPYVILASGDRVAINVEGIKVIQSFPGNALKKDAWEHQIKAAIRLGLGASSEQEYGLIEQLWSANSQ